MNTEERERRQRIWKLLTYEDQTYTEVVETVADEFEVDPDTVEEDIKNIDKWLYKLDVYRDVQGISLLAELRDNRRRLHQLAEILDEQGEFAEERKIRAEINRSINMERHLADSTLAVRRVSLEDEDLLDEMGL
ncbi:PqqD family peptide modification chaperone [Halalkalicoccus jeotgali]|uniref:Uncharacterized protein n=1 Tax=Halalkalicoccus jeotgali (strain DSM 18796 / CECT 7217 / JCM 14584 / KCTC 4019 / B3) TaxID=795797 RepID=D8J6R1_HALJB|nr:PqqD family peptide modification chaperone [Halalkalicoccus jeotgali]ADJ13938.1 hypothetical protein HacjB3_02725 [Halalkalicoccus jeotgali B3]ELY34019.1 hypothetical protein C497_16597 [Halalkalicoccus jeotgali B3]